MDSIETKSSSNKRIAKNTLMLYIRMVLIMAVTLYTSRIVLQVLGVEDYGIYNVVGGVVALLGFFTSSLSNVTQRYISIGLGKNDSKETEIAFRQSFSLMSVLAIIFLIVGEIVGLWFIHNKMVIQEDRIFAAVCVYHTSLVILFLSMLQIPFMGTIISHERMGIYAYIGLFEALARLAIAFALMMTNDLDKLILYGLLMAVVSVCTSSFYAVYSLKNFTECKLQFYWDTSLVKEMARFVGYNLFGCFAWSAGIQGTNILMNTFFGPTINAARAISVQVSTVVTRFTENIMTATKPQIIKSYSANEHSYMMMLIRKSSKYCFFLTAIIAIPIIFELDIILHIWLGHVPDYTIQFTRLVLCDALISVFVPPLWIAANATGNIKGIQVYGRLFTLAILPLSYIALRICENPMFPLYISITMDISYWMYSLRDINKQIGLDTARYAKEVLKSALILSTVLVAIGFLICYLLPTDSLIRFFTVFVSSCISGIITVYCLLDKEERQFVHNILNKICHKK